MLEQKAYQLHGYKIIEHGDAILEWEKYTDFGVQQSGRCSVTGRILIIGNPSNEEIGCLIGEYYEQLKKLPLWAKTKYYCRENAIISIETEKWSLRESLSYLANRYSRDDEHDESTAALYPGKFHLGPYMIKVKADKTILWSTYLGNGRIVGGHSQISGDILFLTERTFEKKQNRKEFQRKIKSLTPWSFTEAYAPMGATILCTERSYQDLLGRSRPHHKLFSSVPATKEKMSSLPNVGRAIQPPKHTEGADTVHTYTRDKIAKGAFSTSVRRLVSSCKGTSMAFISNFFSGPFTTKKEATRKVGRRLRQSWKAGLAGAIITTLGVGTFVVIFLHHEFESLTHIIHPDDHPRVHHQKHHSNH